MTSSSSPREEESVPEQPQGTPVDAETLSRSLQLLIDTAAEQGRDWKLIDALLVTLTDCIEEGGEDVLEPPDSAHPGRRLRPGYRARIKVVVDSLSDDEAADLLGIGTRQLRRRAQDGGLYFFTVGKRRRYPAWQFDERCGVLPGIHALILAIPKDWRPEKAHSFMTTLEAGLDIHGEPIAPSTWLIIGLDPARIEELIRDAEENQGSGIG